MGFAREQSRLWEETGAPAPGRKDGGVGPGVGRRAIQDVLVAEGLLAVRLAEHVESLEELRQALVRALTQNSQETRLRYSQSVLKWFFADGFNGLARKVWLAYRDEDIEKDVLRYLYLVAEPVMAACVADALYPLEDGMRIPASYLDRFLQQHAGGPPPEKTTARLKSNLMRLGFLRRRRGSPDVLNRLAPSSTAFLVFVHHLFAPGGARTVEVRHLLADPFWRYLGFKSEDRVRAVLKEASSAGILAKYVVADELEQITTVISLEEFLARRVRL